MNRAPLNPVTEQDIETYVRDGIVCLRGMFDTAWIEHLKGAVALARTRPGPNFQNHTVDGEAGGTQQSRGLSRIHGDAYVERRLAISSRRSSRSFS